MLPLARVSITPVAVLAYILRRCVFGKRGVTVGIRARFMISNLRFDRLTLEIFLTGMDPRIVENQFQRTIMGGWTALLEGRYMHLGEKLGDILNLVTPTLQQFSTYVMNPYMVDLQILYLISLLTLKWQDIGNDLRILGPYDDFITFITHLRKVDTYLNPVRETANRSFEEEPKE